MFYPRFFGMPTFRTFRPFDELSRMRQQMDRVMDALSGRVQGGIGAGVFPAINLTESDDHFNLRAELPGVKNEDLDIQATANNLTIAGERKLAPIDESAKYHRREREGGRFSRAFALPTEIDPDRIEARLSNGILTVRLPKAESAKPKRIAIGK